MKNRLIPLILLCSSNLAQSNIPQPPPSWTAECTFGERRVTLEAKSKSGDSYEDDMELSIIVGKARLPVGLGKMTARWEKPLPAVVK